MEIEKKYLIQKLPEQLFMYPAAVIEQAYLCTDPVVRVRREDTHYYMTYKGSGLMVREEYNLPLNEQSYLHLKQKADGTAIEKIRYRIPLTDKLTAELDVFQGALLGLVMVEVEFPTEDDANTFVPPAWFGRDVTFDSRYHNSNMSKGIVPPFS